MKAHTAMQMVFQGDDLRLAVLVCLQERLARILAAARSAKEKKLP